ncbi:hypothetical protein BDZ91DRAFT_337408 [Kalaharituber pfeilii]|nr:hypothetical protein BDZ91DRAFT_337408 [Kalaharituber pfeilii]
MPEDPLPQLEIEPINQPPATTPLPSHLLSIASPTSTSPISSPPLRHALRHLLLFPFPQPLHCISRCLLLPLLHGFTHHRSQVRPVDSPPFLNPPPFHSQFSSRNSRSPTPPQPLQPPTSLAAAPPAASPGLQSSPTASPTGTLLSYRNTDSAFDGPSTILPLSPSTVCSTTASRISKADNRIDR